MIYLIRKDGNDPFPGFSNVEDAIMFKRGRELDKEWVLDFDEEDRADYRNQLFAAAQIIHDEMRPKLRHANYEKLLNGKLKNLHGDVCDGYGPISALYAAKMLNMAGHTGWTAVEGTYETKDGPVNHGWLEHANGAVMDIACGHLYRTPVMAIEPLDTECLARYKVLHRIEPTPARLEKMKPGDGMIAALNEIPLYDWLSENVNHPPIYAEPVADHFSDPLPEPVQQREEEPSLG